MPIRYALHPNKLTGNPDDYMAIVHFTRSVDEAAVIERMIQQGSTITKADILAVLQAHHQTIISLVLEGFKVVTFTAIYGASIKGIFKREWDSYNANRHRLEPQVSAGAGLRQAVHRQGRAAKLESVTPSPHPVEYTDVNSGSRDDRVTSGGMARLSGYRLKFDPSDPEQGIFFVAAGGTTTRVEVVAQNKPRHLIFMVPAGLSPGPYALVVRATFKGKLRQGELLASLTVP